MLVILDYIPFAEYRLNIKIIHGFPLLAVFRQETEALSEKRRKVENITNSCRSTKLLTKRENKSILFK